MNKPTRQELNTKRNKRKRRKKENKQRKKARKWFVKLPLFLVKMTVALFVTGLLAGIGGGAYFWNTYGEELSANIAEGFRIADTIDPAHFEHLQPTQLIDGNGDVIREFKERNFKYIDLQEDDDLYWKVSDVVVSIEDERFYRHVGFDYYGVGVAVINHMRGMNLRGASTITQQVVKNTYLTQAQTVDRKVQEAVIAQELESAFSKREILEFYVNGNYYANGQYGLATAAHYYYGKPVAELTSGELAVLVGIPNNPSIYDPVNQPDNAIHKRNVILRKMMELEKISEKEFKEESQKELVLDIHRTPVNNAVVDYGESYAMHQAVEFLMEHSGFELTYWFDTKEDKETYRQAYNSAYEKAREDILRGGFKIETSIDVAQQAILQEAVDKEMNQYQQIDSANGLYAKQASAVTIDNKTNEVVAIVGGRSQTGNTFNRAYLGKRQPASAIKPFNVYAPAFERGVRPQTMMVDKAIKNGPSNWYEGYRGSMSVRYSMEQSINTIAYQLMIDNGVKNTLDKLATMRFASLDPDDHTTNTSVGGFTFGVTPLEMASALNTLVNDGNYTRPSNVRKLSHLHTDEVYYDKSEDERVAVYDSASAYMTLDTMKDVVTNGTGRPADFGYRHLAGKTGSSNERKDQWFIGTTPHYATAVWVGEDQPKAQPYSVSQSPIHIFKTAMERYHKGLSITDFKKPAHVTRGANGSFTVAPIQQAVKDPKQVERERNEHLRVEQETISLKDRLKELEYRIVHGLTLEEAQKRERTVSSLIQLISQVRLEAPDDFGNVDQLYSQGKTALDQVKRASIKAELTQKLESAYRGKMQERDTLIWRIKEDERLRLEEEQRLERMEAQRIEAERQRIEAELQRELEERNRQQEESLNEQFNEPAVPQEEEPEVVEETETLEPVIEDMIDEDIALDEE